MFDKKPKYRFNAELAAMKYLAKKKRGWWLEQNSYSYKLKCPGIYGGTLVHSLYYRTPYGTGRNDWLITNED